MQFLPLAQAEHVSTKKESLQDGEVVQLEEVHQPAPGEVCCGGPPPPPSNPFELAGYQLSHYVHGFVRSKDVNVPLVKTSLEWVDLLGTVSARLGLNRNDYRVSPGLYGIGCPDSGSPVVVTANYKLTFDQVRKALKGRNLWLLVLDTCGINVWCAAGKGTFSTEELVRRIEETGLADRVSHRRLILPQLGATGVAAHEVKLKSGFRVSYGPVEIVDLGEYIDNGMKATERMRAVSFTLWQRSVLVPVEFTLFSKKIWWIFPLLFILSGIGPEVYSLSQMIGRGAVASLAVFAGGIAGAVIMPLLLPWIPGRSFAFKGMVTGVLAGIVFSWLAAYSEVDRIALVCCVSSVSSYLSMNFTGSTPFTSPTGVEKEMSVAIPLQVVVLIVGVVCWFTGPFL